jgi:hypothetical protein
MARADVPRTERNPRARRVIGKTAASADSTSVKPARPKARKKTTKTARATATATVAKLAAAPATVKRKRSAAVRQPQLVEVAAGGAVESLYTRQPMFESLESRQFLSSVTLSGSILTVNGDSNTTRLAVSYNSSANTVTGSTSSGAVKTVSKSQVSGIRIVGGLRSELISVTSQLSIPSTIQGNGGNDTIWAGSGRDSISGGSGNDQIHGRGGNDIIFGRDGNDWIDGGAGTDAANGEAGSDKLLNIEQSPSQSDNSSPPPTSSGGSTGSGTSGASPHPVITALDKSVGVGQALFVNAVQGSTLGTGTPLTARYQWNFGDSGSQYNDLPGFNVAHVYDRPGIYTVSLKITNDDGNSSTATTTVTIGASARNKKIYVSAAGSDSNGGSSQSTPVRTFARAAQLANSVSNAEILFRRGDTFTTSTSFVAHGTNVYVGAYGTDSDPLIKWTGSGYGVIFSNWGHEFSVNDLTFDDPAHATIAFAPHQTGNLIRDCTFLRAGDCVNSNGTPDGVMILDNKVTAVDSLSGYFSWIQGADHVLLGNSVPNSTAQHIVRIGGADRTMAYDNTMANVDRRSQGFSSDIAKGVFVVHKGNYAYISGNRVTSGNVGVGPLGDKDGLSDKAARFNWAVVENNRLTDSTGLVAHGAQHTIFRNNISSTYNHQSYMVDGYNTTYGRGVVDLIFANNTGYNSGNASNFIKFNGRADGVTLVNNLYVAPNMRPGAYTAAPIYVTGSDLSSFRAVSGNVWSTATPYSYAEGGYNYVYSYWSNSAGYRTPTEWNNLGPVLTDFFSNTPINSGTFAPSTSSTAASAGKAYVGVFTDFYGKARSITGTVSAGAVEV